VQVQAAAQTGPSRPFDSLERLFPIGLPLLAVLASGVIAFIWYLHAALVRLDSMQGTAWDLGFDQQVVWNVANGNNFYSTFANANFLAQHFEVVLVIPALIERIWPDPRVLLILGDLGLAATAPAAFLMFTALLGTGARASLFAALVAAPIPFWASTQQAARDDFHPENMALALAMLATWAGLRGRLRLMWVLVLLALSCKEDQVYTIGVAGLVIATSATPELRKYGRWVIGAAVAWLVVMVGVAQNVIRYVEHTGPIYGLTHGGPVASGSDYYDWVFRPSVGVLVHTVANPHGWLSFLVLILSLCALPLLRPAWFLLTLPPLAANLLSHHQPQSDMIQHYALLTMFPMIIAGAMGLRRLMTWRIASSSVTMAALAVVPLVLGYVFGTLPPGLMTDHRAYTVADGRAQLRQAAAFIPADAPVAADDGVTPWLATRRYIEGFPSPGDGTFYVVLDRDAILEPASWTDTHAAAVAALRASGRRLLFDDGRFQVWSPVGG
jgi:uncharacterized membrane protein